MESQLSHDIESIAHDNEQFGSRDGRDIENQLPNPALSVDRILFNAAMRDKWRVAEPILKKQPRLVHQVQPNGSGTLLQIAVQSRSIRFVRELMKLVEVGDFEVKDEDGNNAFYYAAFTGQVEIAKAMREKNKKLPNIRGQDEKIPITVAAILGHKDMVSYLFEVTNFDMIQQEEHLILLYFTTKNEMYEVALNIFNKDRKLLVTKMLQGYIGVLHTLSQKSIAISNAYSPVWRKFISVISISLLKLLPERYVLEKQAGLLLEELWVECKRSGAERLFQLVRTEKLAHSAAKAGNLGFLRVVIPDYPNLIWDVDDKNHTILHEAVLYREEKVFRLLDQIAGAVKNIAILGIDDDDNNILHLAGKLGEPIHKQRNVQSMPPNADNSVVVLQQLIKHITETQEEEKIMPPSFLRVSGAALQMQREILWFKEVEKLVTPSVRNRTNKDGKTPRELFTQEHKSLLKEGERWMKDTSNSCMIVATLIATVVFAAGFTVPGGNNSNSGIPILLQLYGFRIFFISDAVALFTSIVSIIMFLSILTSRYAEDDFLVSLPAKLLFGLTMLFISIVSMLLAFAATFFLVYSNHIGWEPKLIAACAGVPVALFGCLQYKLWLDVAKSTYWSKFLFRSGKYKFD